MSLLPLNSKVIDQNFAEIIDTRSRVDFSDVSIDTLICDSSLLPHIAFSKGANIDNMTESESRLYLKNFRRKSLGTVGAVEDAINVCWDNAHLVEWFNDGTLDKGMFRIDVTLKADTTKVYDNRLFALSNRLIKEAKNVRSKVDSFNIKLPTITAEVKVSSGVNPLKLHPFMRLDEMIISEAVNSESAWIYEPTLKSGVDESITLEDTNLIGGYKWQVEV